MYIFEQIRYLILDDPLKIEPSNNIPVVFVECMFDRLQFDFLILACIIWIIGCLVFLISRKRRDNTEYYYYTVGSFLIYTAIMYRYTYKVIASTSNPNESAVSYGSKNIASALRSIDSRVTPVLDVLIHTNHALQNRSNLIKSAFEIPNFTKTMENRVKDLKQNEPVKEPNQEDVNPIEKVETVKPAEIPKEPEDKKSPKEPIKTPETTKNIKPPEIQKEKEDSSKQEDSSLEESSDKREVPAPTNHPTINLKSKKANPKQKINIKSSEPFESTTREDSSGYREQDVDIYMKKITKTIERENDENEKLKEKVQAYTKLFKRIREDYNEFRSEFNKWYVEANKIEVEMAAFNAPIKNLDQASKEMKTDIENILKLSDAFKSLTTNSAEKSELSMHIKNKKKSKRAESESGNSPSVFLSVYFVVHALLALYFLIAILLKLHYVFLLRWLTFICMVLDLAFGLYMVIYAQVLDKICILGNVEGCKSTFTEGFATFAASAGLNLKKNDQNQKENLYSEINQIQVKAEMASNDLRAYLAESPVEKFRVKSMVFLSLFNKVDFVHEDFDNLSNGKIDKNEFYGSITNMKGYLKSINLTLETHFKTGDILDIYGREIAFLYFIKGEKDALHSQVDRQISRSEQLSPKIKDECDRKKAAICNLKILADHMAFALIIGASIFLLLISL